MPVSSGGGTEREREIVFLDLILKEEAADSSNMSVHFYQSTLLNLAVDNVHAHCHGKFKSGDITHSQLVRILPTPPPLLVMKMY